MQNFPQALRSILTVFWIGGLWVIGLLVAPVLFQQLDTASAGRVAGVLFRGMAWVGMVAGCYIVLHILWQDGLRALRSSALWLIVGMLLLTLLNHFAVFPVIESLRAKLQHPLTGVFGGGFASWHTLSSLIYLVQSGLGLLYILRMTSK